MGQSADELVNSLRILGAALLADFRLMVNTGFAVTASRIRRRSAFSPHSPDDILFFATLTAIQI